MPPMKNRLAGLLADRLEDAARLLRRHAGEPAAGKVLVLGGVRSGKSRHAEHLAARYSEVVYVASGLPASSDDPEWAARVAAHRARRPSHWRTVETTDLAGTLRKASGPLLIDCLGTWLSRTLDDAGAWQQEDGWQERIDTSLAELVSAWQAARVPLIAVSNEVGSGVVPATMAGRTFRDVLGALNTEIAAHSDRVLLVVAGRSMELPR
jgi:adenosylcobinamide kinase/adenosylcobinamide-phosphate guanylyltransferase